MGLGGYVTTSKDGVNWTTPKQIISENLYSIQYGNGVFVTCGGYNIAYSIDGNNWVLISPDISFKGDLFRRVAYKNDTFVASYDNNCYTSVDGKTWSNGVSCGLFSINELISTSDKFIAFYNRKVAISPDGIKWTVSDTSIPTSMHGITYGNGLIVTSVGRVIYVSTDGISCETIQLPNVSGYTSSSSCITFNNGIFIMLCLMQNNRGSSQYATYATTSIDGKTWTEWVCVKDENGQELQNRAYAMIVMP